MASYIHETFPNATSLTPRNNVITFKGRVAMTMVTSLFSSLFNCLLQKITEGGVTFVFVFGECESTTI